METKSFFSSLVCFFSNLFRNGKWYCASPNTLYCEWYRVIWVALSLNYWKLNLVRCYSLIYLLHILGWKLNHPPLTLYFSSFVCMNRSIWSLNWDSRFSSWQSWVSTASLPHFDVQIIESEIQYLETFNFLGVHL